MVLFLLSVGLALGARSWAGNNLYYAPGLYPDTQKYFFSNLRDAGVKVLRVWLDGQTSGSTKGTQIQEFPSLEPYQVGQFDDTVLKLVDDLMITAKSYGIKLLISMHSFNALSANDVYGRRWGTGYFYEQSDATNAFDNRLRHIVSHTHHSLGKQWKDLPEYIFAFEAQNEAMIGKGPDYIAAHQNWQCDRAKVIRSALGSSRIFVTTGGASWLDESMQPDWFSCDALDILAIHAYGTGDFDRYKINNYVQKALQHNKKLIFQEWGACYYTTSNNDCPAGGKLDPNQRAKNIRYWADQISEAGVPWFYWQIIPNKDPHYGYDYEIGMDDEQWDVIKQVASNTTTYNSPFDFGL